MTYSPTSSDDADPLRVIETATNSAGSSTANSAPTAAVMSEDEQAEALAIEAAHDADTWGASNGGSYSGLSLDGLRTIDAAIPVGLPMAGPYIPTSNGVLGTTNGYDVTAVSTNGDTFSVFRIPSTPVDLQLQQGWHLRRWRLRLRRLDSYRSLTPQRGHGSATVPLAISCTLPSSD